MILDLGCGNAKKKGALGVDITGNPDVFHDLNAFPYPFPHEQAEKIYLDNVIEHLENPKRVLWECWLLLQPGGTIEIVTPHFSSAGAWKDITHKRPYAFDSFDDLDNLKIESKRIVFGKAHSIIGVSLLANKFPRFYEQFLTGLFPARELKIILKKVV